MQSNSQVDFMSQKMLKACSSSFLGTAKLDPYNSPLVAPPEWWQHIPVHELCVVCGEYEIFVDDIKAWAEKVKVSGTHY